jgi:molybdopterin converting factor subunit 1
MRVTVACFARLRDLAGLREWPCELPPGATVQSAWNALAAHAPAVDVMRTTISCAVNAEFATMDTPIREGDEVAFLPPVSGGAPGHS